MSKKTIGNAFIANIQKNIWLKIIHEYCDASTRLSLRYTSKSFFNFFNENKIPIALWEEAKPKVTQIETKRDWYSAGATNASIPHTNLFVQRQSGCLGIINFDTCEVVKMIKDNRIKMGSNIDHLIVFNSHLIATHSYPGTIQFWSTNKAKFITEVKLTNDERYLAHDTYRIYIKNKKNRTICYLDTTKDLNVRHLVYKSDSYTDYAAYVLTNHSMIVSIDKGYILITETTPEEERVITPLEIMSLSIDCVTPNGDLIYISEKNKLFKFSNGVAQELKNAAISYPDKKDKIIVSYKLCALDDDHVLIIRNSRPLTRHPDFNYDDGTNTLSLYSLSEQKIIMTKDFDGWVDNVIASQTGKVLIQYAYDNCNVPFPHCLLSFPTAHEDKNDCIQSTVHQRTPPSPIGGF